MNGITKGFQALLPEFPVDLLKALISWSGFHFRSLRFLEIVLRKLSGEERKKPIIQNIIDKWIMQFDQFPSSYVYNAESIRKAIFQEKVFVESTVNLFRRTDLSVVSMTYSRGKHLNLIFLNLKFDFISTAISQNYFLNSLDARSPKGSVPQTSPISLIRYFPGGTYDMILVIFFFF